MIATTYIIVIVLRGIQETNYWMWHLALRSTWQGGDPLMAGLHLSSLFQTIYVVLYIECSSEELYSETYLKHRVEVWKEPRDPRCLEHSEIMHITPIQSQGQRLW